MKQQQADPSASLHSLSPPIPLLLLSLHVLAILILDLSIKPTNAHYCYNNLTFTPNSDYARNRALILSSDLASHVAQNGGYYTSSTSDDPHVVYVVGLCRADSSNDTCFRCMSSAAQDLMVKCPNQTQAFSWGTGDPPCFVRSSNVPIYGTLQLFPTEIAHNTAGRITMNLDQFDPIWGNWTSGLALNASNRSLKLKFAAGTTILPNFMTLYGYTQCIPDLSPTSCYTCLTTAMDAYKRCCHGNRGGAVYIPSCQFRWETYPFLEPVPSPPPPPPSPPTAATAPPPPSPPNARASNGTPTEPSLLTLGLVI